MTRPSSVTFAPVTVTPSGRRSTVSCTREIVPPSRFSGSSMPMTSAFCGLSESEPSDTSGMSCAVAKSPISTSSAPAAGFGLIAFTDASWLSRSSPWDSVATASIASELRVAVPLSVFAVELPSSPVLTSSSWMSIAGAGSPVSVVPPSEVSVTPSAVRLIAVTIARPLRLASVGAPMLEVAESAISVSMRLRRKNSAATTATTRRTMTTRLPMRRPAPRRRRCGYALLIAPIVPDVS